MVVDSHHLSNHRLIIYDLDISRTESSLLTWLDHNIRCMVTSVCPQTTPDPDRLLSHATFDLKLARKGGERGQEKNPTEWCSPVGKPMINKSRVNINSKKIEDYRDDPRKKWQVIKDLLHPSRSSRQLLHLMKILGWQMNSQTTFETNWWKSGWPFIRNFVPPELTFNTSCMTMVLNPGK